MAQQVTMKDAPATEAVFMRFAAFAAGFERSGKYAEAAVCWQKAGNAAVREINRTWAGDRRDFCSHALVHGWGQQHAGSGV